jgi:hypothetical protein
VGSSFGGAVAVVLLQRGAWRGPTLLLAPAAVELGVEPRLPLGHADPELTLRVYAHVIPVDEQDLAFVDFKRLRTALYGP